MDTRVHFLQLVRLQVTHTPFEFVQVLSFKVDLPHLNDKSKQGLIDGISI